MTTPTTASAPSVLALSARVRVGGAADVMGAKGMPTQDQSRTATNKPSASAQTRSPSSSRPRTKILRPSTRSTHPSTRSSTPTGVRLAVVDRERRGPARRGRSRHAANDLVEEQRDLPAVHRLARAGVPRR